MAAVDVQTVKPRALGIGHLPGVLAEHGIGLVECFGIGQRPDNRQVVGAGATKRGPALQGLRVEVCFAETLYQVRRNFFQQIQIALMAFRCGGQVFVMKIEAGPHRVLAQTPRRHITFGADHGAKHRALRGFNQLGDLPANALKRQTAAGREAFDLGRPRQNHHRCAGQYLFALAGLPLALHFIELQHVMVGQDADVGVQRLKLAQSGRMHPAAFRVKKPAMGQVYACQGLCLGLIQHVHQRGREGSGQLPLTLGLLGIETQLQHAAIIPVAPALQVLEHAAGVAKATDDHLRQCRAVGGQLEVQHPLRVAGGFFGQAFVTLQQQHLPAALGQAVGAGATRQTTADHQRGTRAADLWRASEPGFDRGAGQSGFWQAEKDPAQDLPLVADTRRAAHFKAGLIQRAAYPAGAGKGAEGGLGSGQTGQLCEQFGRPHVRVFRGGEAVQKPRVDLRIELWQLLQRIADQQRERDLAIGQTEGLKPRMNGPIACQQLLAVVRQLRPESEGALQVRAGQRVFFGTDEMQAGLRVRRFVEQLPRTEKVEAGPEAGFTNHKMRVGGQGAEALAQGILFNKDVTGFFKAGLV